MDKQGLRVTGRWMHGRMIMRTVLEFCEKALPDFVLMSGHDRDWELVYEMGDAVPSEWGGRAFNVRVPIEMEEAGLPDAEVSLVVEEPKLGDAYVHDVSGVRCGFDDVGTTLIWNPDEGLWETFGEDDEDAA